MARAQTADVETTRRRLRRATLAAALVALAIAVVLLLAHGGPDLLKGAVLDDVGAGEDETDYAGELEPVTGKIDSIRRPLTVAFGSLVSVGLLSGGVALAVGMKMGIKLISTSGLAGAAILVGNGVVE